MGLDKQRKKKQFAGPVVVVGSLGLQGPVLIQGVTAVQTTIAFGGTMTLSGAVTARAMTVTGSFAVSAGVSSFGGTVRFAGLTQVSTTAAFGGTTTLSGAVTLGGATTVSTPLKAPGGSAAAQFFGLTSVGCGVASVVVSTSVVKSNAVITVTPILRSGLPAAQASGSIPLCLSVVTVAEGAFFTIGWLGGVGATNTILDAAWEIKLQS